MTKIRSYRDLLVWQKGVELVVLTYKLCEQLLRSEQFGLKAQMERAAVSIPANIAEGHGRRLTGEYLHHLAIANGSLMELETHFEIVLRLGFAKKVEVDALLARSAELGRMLFALMEKLKERKTAGSN